MKVLLVDNYDSFTYNLAHYLENLGSRVMVKRNDELGLEEVRQYSHICLSPGPGLPKAAGLLMALVENFQETRSILGVCLGCQALAEQAGARLYNQQEVAHGLGRTVQRYGESWLLQGLPQQFTVGLYHSWAIEAPSLAPPWRVTARRQNGVVMAMEHAELPLAGVQFHPESILSQGGYSILENWLHHQPVERSHKA